MSGGSCRRPCACGAAAEAARGASADDVAALLARAVELAEAQGSVLFAERARAQLAG